MPANIPKLVKATSGAYVVINSGVGTLISGQTISTRPQGQSEAPFSGYACTNTLVYSGVGFITHGKATLLMECLEEGSGVQYTIRGEPMSGVLTYSITSGVLTSGEQAIETISDPYDWIEVGFENVVDNYTGVVTLVVARR